jgi:hypothetical protein
MTPLVFIRPHSNAEVILEVVEIRKGLRRVGNYWISKSD